MKKLKESFKNFVHVLLRSSETPESVIAGIFNDEESFLKAAQTVKGVKGLDAITPYPVHGLEDILKIKRSWLPWVTLTFGLIGLTGGLLLTWWTSVISWPLVIGGKPFFSLPAFIPVMFECTILFSALATVGALFYVCGLPKIKPPILDKDLTSHKFALYCPSLKNNKEDIEKKFKDVGAVKVIVAQF